ncbi:MAG TPA: T9SS type A sorting domain-containing protein [Cryomorphaceae bacterium]|nr:T9SS type A sorting domain-containing protein [Cryomorphaceae bacterium]
MKQILLGATLFTSLFAFSQDEMTFAQIFNFDIGDEFHYSAYRGYSQMDNSYIKEEFVILDKCYSEEFDSIIYVRDVIRIEDNYFNNFNGELEQYTDTVFYTNLSAVLTTDSVYNDADRFNGNDIYTFLSTESWSGNQNQTVTEYVELLGEVKYSFDFWNLFESVGEWKKLVYYRKVEADQEWGTPYNLLKNNNIQFDDLVIYPNPTTGIVNWKERTVFGSPKSIQVLDLNGMKVVQEIAVSSNSIDLSGHNSGLYLLRLEYENRVFTSKVEIRK